MKQYFQIWLWICTPTQGNHKSKKTRKRPPNQQVSEAYGYQYQIRVSPICHPPTRSATTPVIVTTCVTAFPSTTPTGLPLLLAITPAAIPPLWSFLHPPSDHWRQSLSYGLFLRHNVLVCWRVIAWWCICVICRGAVGICIVQPSQSLPLSFSHGASHVVLPSQVRLALGELSCFFLFFVLFVEFFAGNSNTRNDEGGHIFRNDCGREASREP